VGPGGGSAISRLLGMLLCLYLYAGLPALEAGGRWAAFSVLFCSVCRLYFFGYTQLDQFVDLHFVSTVDSVCSFYSTTSARHAGGCCLYLPVHVCLYYTRYCSYYVPDCLLGAPCFCTAASCTPWRLPPDGN
jgi:hypothetical protein